MSNYRVRDIRITFAFFSFILIVTSFRHYPSLLSYIFFILAFILIFFLTFVPLSLSPLFERWLKITRVIAKFNTKVLLFISFVVIFLPTGLVRRLSGKDAMQRDIRAGSYWEHCDNDGLKDKSRYEKQF
ncbi:MAG: hypothetical protein IT392_07220 [Nitrospirae bacterium]|nr:hypothetical protein [Nitrospirota bacterium]